MVKRKLLALVKRHRWLLALSLYCLVIAVLAAKPWEEEFYPKGRRRPEFSVAFIDNDENDYVDIKYVDAGWGFGGLPDPLPLEHLRIFIWDIDRRENYLELYLPSGGTISLNENIRVSTHADVIEEGKAYRWSIWSHSGGYACKDAVVAKKHPR